jgi:hypothetical protein
MPLRKNGTATEATTLVTKADEPTLPNESAADANMSSVERIGGTYEAGDRAKTPMTRDDYWRRREERDIQRDKDMAWSGIAQAALASVGVIQLNADNTEDGLVALVVRITDKLLKARDDRNG